MDGGCGIVGREVTRNCKDLPFESHRIGRFDLDTILSMKRNEFKVRNGLIIEYIST